MTTTTTICATTAAEIERHHRHALEHATTAVNHARAAGRLLIEVKRALPHGQFLAWLEQHVTLSARQAQRYMRAAEGKPLTARRIAALPTKYDTVSHLTARMPNVKVGELVRVVAVVPDGWHDEFVFLPEIGGRVFVAHINGPAVGENLADEGTVWSWTKTPIAVADLRHNPTVFSFPWDRGEIVERRPHPGFERHPFGEMLK